MITKSFVLKGNITDVLNQIRSMKYEYLQRWLSTPELHFRRNNK